MAENWQKLIDVLLKKNLVKQKTLTETINRYRSTGETVEKVLVKSGLITREQLLELKHEVYGVEVLPLDPASIDPALGQLIPQSMATRYGVLCVARKDNQLTLLSSEPLDAIAMDYIRMRSGFEVRFRLGYAGDVEEARERIYPGLAAAEPPKTEFATRRQGSSDLVLRRGPLNEVVQRDDKPHKTVQLPELGLRSTRPNGGTPAAPARGRTVAVSGGVAMKKGNAAAVAAKGSKFVPLEQSKSCPQCRTTLDLNHTHGTMAQLERILTTVTEACDTEAASLLVLEADGRSLFFKHAVGGGAADIINIIVPLNEASVAGWVLGHRKPLVLNNTEADPLHNKETDKMLQFATHRIAAAPVMWGDRLLGVVEAVNKRLGGFSEADVEVLRVAAAQIAIALHNESTAAQLSGLIMETVNVLAELLQLQGKVSRKHLVEVAQFATAMGREAGLDETQMEVLSHAGILHDIGTLAQDEGDDQAEHPKRGADLLARVPMLANLVPHIRMHHERWDGSGPQRLRELQIPLPARILAVAEAWCESGDTLEHFLTRFGSDFDPALKEAFLTARNALSRGEAAAT